MKILYITYDGLLDPLGSSQILPYIYGIKEFSDSIFIISFEKSEKYNIGYSELNNFLLSKNIYWKPLLFSERFGVLGKVWDLIKIYIKSAQINFIENIDIAHARGHVAAAVALFLKRFFKTKFLFDFRGLWVDERVDKGGWDLSKTIDLLQFKYFKSTERKLLVHADHIVVLTNKVIGEIVKIASIQSSKITVIPCCADFSHFTLQTQEQKNLIRRKLKIPSEALVLGYLGSVGSMYLIEDYYRLVEIINLDPDYLKTSIYGLVITNNPKEANTIKKKILSSKLQKNIIVMSALRKDVPNLLCSFDVMVSFIANSYARQAASPTKIAESFASGIPVISNAGIGDVDEQIFLTNGGEIIHNTSISELQKVPSKLNRVLASDKVQIRQEAQSFLSLDIANSRYKAVYSNINMNKNA
jgi:glycosyltransferase involved in cell wall biosynthesis